MKVEKLSVGDVVTIDHEKIDGEWSVSDVTTADLGISTIPIATVTRGVMSYSIIGNLSNGGGETVQIRTLDDEEVANIHPSDIES